MMKKHGSIEVHRDGADLEEFIDLVETLPEGEYEYVLYDKFKNRSLPHLKYLFGVVFKTISEQHPEKPEVDALYRYFESIFAPIHTCEIDGQKFEYFDLKNEKTKVLFDVTEKILQYARCQWNITIPDRDFLKLPEARQLYVEANYDMWKNIQSQTSTNS